MEISPWVPATIALLAWGGTLQATSLAIVFLSPARTPLPGRSVVAVQLGLVACLSVVVLLSHQAPGDPRTLERIETFAWLLAGPLFLLYVRRTFGLPSPSLLHLAPALALGSLTASGMPAPDPLALVLLQGAYTLWGLHLFVRSPDGGSAARGWCRIWLWFLGAVHGAQLVRTAFADVRALENVVPLTVGLALTAVVVLGLRHSSLLEGDLEDRRAPDAFHDLPGRIREKLEQDRLFLEPDLTVQQLARSLGVPRADVSACLNRSLGRSFTDLMAGYRVAEAKRLLGDPSLAHLTIEAIGHRAGFRTRSTFYHRFRGETGQTPATFRASACPDDV